MSKTLKELARELGVSPATISRALNGQEQKRTSTRKRAEQIRLQAAQAGYTPNSVARSLKTNRRRVIGLILPDIMNEYYATAATLAQQTLATAGYRALLGVTYDDPASEDAHLRVFMEERVAGIIVVPSPRHSAARASWSTMAPGIPVVELVRQSMNSESDAVLLDDVESGHQGTRHLLQLGHRRIAVLAGPPSLSTARQRVEGYRLAMSEAGLAAADHLILSGAYRRDAARAITLAMLAQPNPPTALLATSSELVVGVLQAVIAQQRRIPDDLSLVGFGNPDWFGLLNPALTTMALPISDMAMVAVHLLRRRIEAGESTEVLPVAISRYQAQLIVRASTAPLRVR